MAEEKKAPKGKEVMDAKKVLKTASEQGRKVKRTDRMELEILKDTKFYKKGQIVTPHPVLGEELVAKKIAKELK